MLPPAAPAPPFRPAAHRARQRPAPLPPPPGLEDAVIEALTNISSLSAPERTALPATSAN
jgi:hypothetical protein